MSVTRVSSVVGNVKLARFEKEANKEKLIADINE